MPPIRRIYCNAYPYFITSVTHDRKPVLLDDIDLLWNSINSAREKISFDLDAWVILPEHFHFLINLRDANISQLLQRIKLSFSLNYSRRHNSQSRTIWQKSFWDHMIRNEQDYFQHLNYIHYNPVKHGLVNRPFDYKYSSIHKFSDFYHGDWGIKDEPELDRKCGE